MTKARLESLVLARRACLALVSYATGTSVAMLGDQHRPLIAALIEEFSRLDKAEQRTQATRTPPTRTRRAKA